MTIDKKEADKKTAEVLQDHTMDPVEKKEYLETAAKRQGWKDEGDFDPDNPEKEYLDAETFLRLGPTLGRIKKQTKEMQELRDENQNTNTELTDIKANMNTFREHMLNLNKANIEKERREQRERYKDALSDEEPDLEVIKEIEEEMDKLEKVSIEAGKPEPKPDPKPDVDKGPTEYYKQWIKKNPWAEDDDELREYSVFVGNRLQQKLNVEGRGMTEVNFFKQVKADVQKVYPGKFEAGNADSNVESPSGRGNSGGDTTGVTIGDLTPVEEKAMKAFIKDGIIKDESEYLSDLTIMQKEGKR